MPKTIGDYSTNFDYEVTTEEERLRLRRLHRENAAALLREWRRHFARQSP